MAYKEFSCDVPSLKAETAVIAPFLFSLLRGLCLFVTFVSNI